MNGIELLRRIDGYLDAVPRSVARTETFGALTLFVNDGPGWRYYARPTTGAGPVSPDDIRAARKRQLERRHPQAFEWIVELNPEMGGAAREAGLIVAEHPLMVLDGDVPAPADAPPDVTIALLGHADDVATAIAVTELGLGAAGTATGAVGPAALADVAERLDPTIVGFTRSRIETGHTITAVARSDGVAVAAGSHNPVDTISELVGIATLPSQRRRGIGAALTAFLVQDACGRGIETIFLSADGPDVARIYERVGFKTIGTAGAAER
jgi:ribosomal protein S18 acetylase RimI-like enzyme